MRSTSRTARLAGVLTVLTACGGFEVEPRRMTLDVSPKDARGLYLNEQLILTFSADVDPTSITPESLRIVARDGTEARGRWTVLGRQVVFQPEPVLARDLQDGGYRPGTTYTLQVAGFPRLDGVRGIGGIPLGRSYRWVFETVAVGDAPRAYAFDDASPEQCAPVRLALPRKRPLTPGEPLYVHSLEPLDPSSLHDEDYRIEQVTTRDEVVRNPDTGEARVERSSSERRIPVVARFLENHPEGSRGRGEPCAIIELVPTESLEPGPEHYYYFRAQSRLTDYRGNPARFPDSFREFHVEHSLEAGGNRLHLTFLDQAGFIPLDVPESDGTAHWSDTGLLEIRYPAAAGSGAHGVVELSGPSNEPDLHGTRVHVPKGARATLAPGPGLRVVRSQGRLSVAGRLERTAGDRPLAGPSEGELPFLPGETLSAWLERAVDWDWTVLIAGGDLVIDGSVDVDTPLLLVAGGWIRVVGRARARRGQLWLLRDGGGNLEQTASAAKLVIDPPEQNLLCETLRFSVVTSPLPSKQDTYRWIGFDEGGHAGGGRFEVSFLPASGPIDRARAVRHPRSLRSEGQLRILMDLEIGPGDDWDPPTLDYVDLTWEE